MPQEAGITDKIVIVALSFVSMLPAFLYKISFGDILNLNFSFSPGMLSILLFPIIFAYISLISLRAFQRDAVWTGAVLVLSPLGIKFLVLGLTIFLGSLIVSYQARNIFNGRNYFWTSYRSSSYAFVVLALVASSTFVVLYNFDNDVREQIRGALIAKSVELTATFSEQISDIKEQQVEMAKSVAESSITAAEANLYKDIQSSRLDFSIEQFEVMQESFKSSRKSVTAQIETRASQQGMNIDPTPVISKMIEPFLEPSLPINAMVFLLIFSIIYLLKIPFGLISALYSKIIIFLY